MAKISALPEVTDPDGHEQVVVLKDGLAQRTKMTDLVSSAADAIVDEVTAKAADLGSTDSGKGTALVGQKQRGTGAASLTAAEKLYETITPYDFGAVGDRITDDSDAMDKAKAAAILYQQPLVVPYGSIAVSRTFVMDADGLSLVIMPGASLVAIDGGSGFEGGAVVAVGTTASIASYWRITGGGSIECETLCDFGVEVVYGRFGRIDLDVNGAQVSPIVIGSPTAAAKSYEVHIHGITLAYPDQANTENGIGVWWRTASDCYASQVVTRGYRKGFHTEAACGNITMVQCHPWIRPEHGVMTHGFKILGSNNVCIDCYADTPTNYGDTSIADCYGFYNGGFSNRFYSIGVLLNTATFDGDLATDGVVTAFYGETNRKGEIFGLRAVGASTDKRFKALTQGPSGALDSTYRVDGLNDDGASRFSALDPGRGLAFSGRHPITINSTMTVNGFAYFNTGADFSAARVSGSAGTNRDFVLSTLSDGSYLDRWRMRCGSGEESGSNAGSAFLLNAYNDAGAFLLTAMTIARSTGEITTAGGISLPANKTYKVNNTAVVGSRKAGWSPATGTAARGAFDTSTATVSDLAQRFKALLDDLISHGLIGA